MASKKRQSEGIALLSLYADEDDDMEEEPNMNDAVQQPADPQNGDVDELEAATSSDQVFNHESMIVEESIEIVTTTTFFTENSTPKAVGNSAPPPLYKFRQILSRSRSERLTIVDYGHDEAALSPEADV